MAQVQLSFDHPIVTEWTKVYDMVMRFRDGLVAMFTESGPSLAALVEDLQTMEVYQMDRSQEVQGQITQMRSVAWRTRTSRCGLRTVVEFSTRTSRFWPHDNNRV